jgi:doubled CXXCH motif protein
MHAAPRGAGGKAGAPAVFTLLAALVVALAWTPTPADAGEYHFGATLVCDECHVLADAEHAFMPRPSAGTSSSAPLGYALREEGDALCLRCHDGKANAPDVLGDNTGTHTRQAGGLATGAPPYEAWKGHRLGVTMTPPGGSVSVTLHCTSCHAAHGTPYYRNLPAVTYAKGANDPARDVFLRSWAPGELATNYSADNVDFNEPNAHGSAIGEFCKRCHAAFHVTIGLSHRWTRHPTGNADLGMAPWDHASAPLFGSHPYRVKVMSPLGAWGTPGVPWPAAPPTLTPTCVTCHRAHGSQRPFALIYATGRAPISEDGDGRTVRELCRQCHPQGG